MGISNKRYIFVTGHPRSGTTFIGKTMASPKGVQYLSEPFNPNYGHANINRYFSYISDNYDAYSEHVSNVLDDFYKGKAKFRSLDINKSKSYKQLAGRVVFGNKNAIEYKNFIYNPLINTAIIKDPTIALATRHFITKLDTQTLYLIRHPAAVIASMKRLGMDHKITHMLNQDALVKDHLSEFISKYNIDKLNTVQQHAIHWLFINSVALNDNLNNKNMVLKTHESISINPVQEFKDIFKKFNLNYSDKIESKIKAQTSDKNPAQSPGNQMHYLNRNSKENIYSYKKILSKDEIYQIKEITYDFASKYYPKSSWA